MTFRFTCPCGQQLQAKDELAGRVMKCPACGTVQAIPGTPVDTPAPASAGPPPQAPANGPVAGAATTMVRFECACGRRLQARAEAVGRPARCPSCASVVAIADAPPLVRFRCACGQAIQAREDYAGRAARCPACARTVLIPPEDDPRFHELIGEHPGLHAAPSAGPWLGEGFPQRGAWGAPDPSRWPGVAAVVLVLVLAGGGAAALFWPQITEFFATRGAAGGSAKTAKGGKGGMAVVSLEAPPVDLSKFSDLELVPRDALGFVSLRVADWWNSEAGKKVQAQ